ncbi:hypothetical protein C7S15_2746 [Burkholderia cepacia]|nr:hypothetical protein [Burkholderia cepacia]
MSPFRYGNPRYPGATRNVQCPVDMDTTGDASGNRHARHMRLRIALIVRRSTSPVMGGSDRHRTPDRPFGPPLPPCFSGIGKSKSEIVGWDARSR